MKICKCYSKKSHKLKNLMRISLVISIGVLFLACAEGSKNKEVELARKEAELAKKETELVKKELELSKGKSTDQLSNKVTQISTPTQPPTKVNRQGAIDKRTGKNQKRRKLSSDAKKRISIGRADCRTGHWIDSVSDDGSIIKLEDGSVWKVDAVDTVDSSLWLSVTDVIVCDGKMINTDDNESVGVTKLK